jgi:hypothetical protein
VSIFKPHTDPLFAPSTLTPPVTVVTARCEFVADRLVDRFSAKLVGIFALTPCFGRAQTRPFVALISCLSHFG